MLSGTLAPNAGSIRFEGREIGGPAAAPHHQSRHRPHLPDSPAVPPAVDPRERGAGRASSARAGTRGPRPSRRPSGRSALVGLPTDRAATVDGLGAAALKKLELAKALATGPQAPAGRREPERPRRARDGPGRRHAAPDLQGARHHHHLGRAHHGRPDAGGGSRHGARSRREDRRGPARAGRGRSPRDRGLSRHPRRGAVRGRGGRAPAAPDRGPCSS